MNTGPNTGKGQDCKDLTKTFPTDYSGRQCSGLNQYTGVKNLAGCSAACCAKANCEIYQFCPGGGDKCGALSCWIGQLGGAGGPGACTKQAGWESRGRQGSGPSSHRRDCHFDDALSPSLLKHLLKVEGGAAE